EPRTKGDRAPERSEGPVPFGAGLYGSLLLLAAQNWGLTSLSQVSLTRWASAGEMCPTGNSNKDCSRQSRRARRTVEFLGCAAVGEEDVGHPEITGPDRHRTAPHLQARNH